MTEIDATWANRQIDFGSNLGCARCPSCDALNVFLAYSVPEIRDARKHVECRICSMRGPEIAGSNEDAVAAWNALPRRLATVTPKGEGRVIAWRTHIFESTGHGKLSRVILDADDVTKPDGADWTPLYAAPVSSWEAGREAALAVLNDAIRRADKNAASADTRGDHREREKWTIQAAALHDEWAAIRAIQPPDRETKL